jgi:NAD(P)-dependent dehydrogenase (short-subunit alcohol dehydrogenase family)
MKLFDLTGEVAFVTGAGTGIGKAIAVGLAEAGADVACFGRSRKRAELEETAHAVAAFGRRAIVLEGTVTSADDLAAAVGAVESNLGPLTVAVNNAGVANAEPALSMTLERWNALYEINATGVFLSCQAEGAVMVPRRRGTIINIASTTTPPRPRSSSCRRASRWSGPATASA